MADVEKSNVERNESENEDSRKLSSLNDRPEIANERSDVIVGRRRDKPKKMKKHRTDHDISDDDLHRRKKRRKSHEDDEDDENSNEGRQRRKHSKESHKKKKKRKSHHRKDKERRRKHRSRSYSSDSESEDSRESDDTNHSGGHRKRFRSKARYKDDNTNDHHRCKREHRESKRDDQTESPNDPPDFNSTFGKYGIIKASDYHKQQRSFEVWMTEVKGIPSFTGPKWELQKYFQEYMEDFNTATLPHIKYYHFEKWEMEEYDKQQKLLQHHSGSGALQDEARHRQEMLEKARLLKQQELELVRASMNPEKVQEMKQQLLLKTEMAHAFKTGDKEKFARLQRRLEPDQK